MRNKLLLIIPTYGKFQYAEIAADSAAKHTEDTDVTIAILDDASPEGLATQPTPGHIPDFLKELICAHADKPHISWAWNCYPANGGLTRSWNDGLALLRAATFTHACVTNSDVYFPPGWNLELFRGLERHALVGPVTNAPGTEEAQYVARYSVLYTKRDANDSERIDACQRELMRNQAGRTKQHPLNGFCLMAKASTWLENMYDKKHFFAPRNDFNSKGEPNPTPLMTLNEYELQQRWVARGLTTAICLGSYVFHYRAVSRGDKYKRGDWHRLETE